MTDTPTQTTFSKYLQWFESHERLILALALGFFIVYVSDKGFDYLIKHDQTQAQIATVQAKDAATKVSTDDTQNKLLLTQLAALQQQNNLTNQRIDQLMQQRAQQTKVQKQNDDQAQPTELAQRIRSIIGKGTIVPATTSSPITGGLVFDSDAAHATADMLEDGLQATADLVDTNTKLTACNTLTTSQANVIQGLKLQVNDGGTALTKEQEAHAADVKTLNAKVKRSWLRGFKVGAIVGFVGGLFAAHSL
jgi:hypothetical protein